MRKELLVAMVLVMVSCLVPGCLVPIQVVVAEPILESDIRVERAEGSIRVGMGAVTIDPPWPVYVPYGERVKVHEFYGGPTYAKAVVFEVGELRVAWVVLDVIGINWHRMNYIKERIAVETGLPFNNIMLKATHNHCYPRVQEGEILNLLAERSAQAVKEALDGLFDARIGIGHRVLRRDIVVNRDNFDGPVFTDLYVMRIDDREGFIRGVIFNFPAHPVIFTPSWSPDRPGKIGTDWPGMARQYIQQRFTLDMLYELYTVGREVPVGIFTMFTQGGCGSLVGLKGAQQPIEHVDDGVPVPFRRTLTETVARNTLDMLPEIETTEQVILEFRWKLFENSPLQDWIVERLEEKEVPSPWGEHTLLQSSIFNDETIFSTFPAEMVAEQVVAFREHSGFRHSIILEHANDHHGYPRPKGQVIEGLSWGAVGGRALFAPDHGDRLLSSMLKLVNPDFKPFQPFDERIFGTIRGTVHYDGEQRIEIVIGNWPTLRHPSDKVVEVGEDGSFEITHLLPGKKFLQVFEVAVVPEEELPLLRGWPAEERMLISNYPVTVRVGRETVVHFHLYQEMVETRIEAIHIETLELEGNRISGRVQIEGELSPGERIEGGLFPFGVLQLYGHLVLNMPVVHLYVDEDGTFVFDGLPSGEYRVLFWLDINGNGRRDVWVDLFSPPSNVLVM